MNYSQNTFNDRDKAILSGDEYLKKQIDKDYSNKNKFMIEQLKQNKELLKKYKIRFENNEKLFLEQYRKDIGTIVKSKNEFINTINKKNIFNLFGIESGGVYKSNIIDINIYKEINHPEKDIRDKLMKNFFYKYNVNVGQTDLLYIEENGTMINMILKKESYHYIDFDNSQQPYLYIAESSDSAKYMWKYSVFDIYCSIYNYTVGEAIEILSKKLDIQISSINREIKKYYENINWIESQFSKYPNLFKLIKDSKKVLKAINKLSIERVYRAKYEDKVYIVVDYLTIAQEVGLKKSTVTPYINLFCALGLLEKKLVSNKNKKRNDITSFYVPKYDNELFNYADYKSKSLLDMNISKSKFDVNSCEKAFGLEVAKNIFQDNNTSKKLHEDKEKN